MPSATNFQLLAYPRTHHEWSRSRESSAGSAHHAPRRHEHEQHEEHGREQPSSSSHVEAAQPHPTPILDLGDQQRRDEEPGQHEEHVDAEETAAQRRPDEVVPDNERDGGAPEAVEHNEVGKRDPPRCEGDGEQAEACDLTSLGDGASMEPVITGSTANARGMISGRAVGRSQGR